MFFASTSDAGVYVSKLSGFIPSNRRIRNSKIHLHALMIELGRYDQVKSLVLPLAVCVEVPTGMRDGSLHARRSLPRRGFRGSGDFRGNHGASHRRVLGPSHPDTLQCLVELDRASMTPYDSP